MDRRLTDYRNRIEEVMVNKRPFKYHDNLYPWPFVDGRITEAAYDLAFEVPYGYSADDMYTQVDALSAACGAIVEVKNRAGVVVISVYPQDFAHPIDFSDWMLSEGKKTEILLGLSRDNQPVLHDLKTHLGIGGMPGYGKTDLLRFILWVLIHKHKRSELEIHLIDFKGFSFMPFLDTGFITQEAYDLLTAFEVLKEDVKELHQRARDVRSARTRDKIRGLKRIVIVVDEAASISPNGYKGKQRELATLVEEACSEIARLGRELRFHVIYCTQRPDAEYVNPQIKMAMESFVGFRTATESNSRVIIDRGGLEKLPLGIAGRAIYSTDGRIFQVPFVGDDKAWEKALSPYKEVQRDKTRADKKQHPKTPDNSSDDFNDTGGDILS